MPAPRFVDLDARNVDAQHLCCAIAGNEHGAGVAHKRAFLRRGFPHGLAFRKLDVRGKVFVEYAPAEAAWRPVIAPGFLVIHCLWVSGRYKGHGFGAALLAHVRRQARAARGVVAVAGRKPYLTDTAFWVHHGFQVVDRTEAGFDLVCLPTRGDAAGVRFPARCHRGTVPQRAGVHFEYASQCPFVPGCLASMVSIAAEHGLPVTRRELRSARAAQRCASPFGTFGVFLHGRFLTHELMGPAKFRALLRERLGG
ncbi:MAG: hypothetical protein FJ265_07280 [Planctomycetes bacterium]|nr:hypothetical protein [Planctomycetota bacterium]